ncbi:MAG: hypothetical protein KHW62_02185 [Clostridiales bacterium]|nr:hypothetical protein [Clostridiales bacterium]
MKHSFSRRKKIFLSVTAGVVLVVFLAGAAGAAEKTELRSCAPAQKNENGKKIAKKFNEIMMR